MFLALTADDRFWDSRQKILFLGEWCRLHAKKDLWSSLPHDVLPYPWDDRKRLFADYERLMALYENILPRLADRLNRLHGTDRSARYWRLVVGPWLYYFIQVLYERFLCLDAALARGDATETWVPAEGPVAPSDYKTFVEWVIADDYNLLLYGEILRRRGGIRLSTPRGVPLRLETKPPRLSLAKKIRRGLFRATLFLAGRNRIVLVAPYFSFWENLRLHFTLREVPVVGDLVALEEKPTGVDMEGRRSLVLPNAANPFENVLFDLIAGHMPTIYVERYSSTVAWAQSSFPRGAQAIITANCLLSHDPFKFWAADRMEHGARVVGIQHGGHYGAGLWNSEEEHEVAVSDRYFSWGWRNERAPQVVPLGASKLPGKERAASSGGRILWVLMSIPRYSYWMYSIPVGPQHLMYLRDQETFIQSLRPEVLARLLGRLHPADFGWEEAGRLSAAFPGLEIYRGKARLIDQLESCQIFIGTYNATAYLESLALNRPTILYWNPRQWELRPSAVSAFAALKKARILHDTPEAAAEHLNRIVSDPDAWWRGESVQAARRDFCAQFAKRPESGLRTWAEALREVAASPVGLSAGVRC